MRIGRLDFWSRLFRQQTTGATKRRKPEEQGDQLSVAPRVQQPMKRAHGPNGRENASPKAPGPKGGILRRISERISPDPKSHSPDTLNQADVGDPSPGPEPRKDPLKPEDPKQPDDLAPVRETEPGHDEHRRRSDRDAGRDECCCERPRRGSYGHCTTCRKLVSRNPPGSLLDGEA